MFHREIKKGEEEKAWLSGMKYFQIYNYFDELKEIMTIYNLTGKKNIVERHKESKMHKITLCNMETLQETFKTKISLRAVLQRKK